jgi:hypothetical protein
MTGPKLQITASPQRQQSQTDDEELAQLRAHDYDGRARAAIDGPAPRRSMNYRAAERRLSSFRPRSTKSPPPAPAVDPPAADPGTLTTRVESSSSSSSSVPAFREVTIQGTTYEVIWDGSVEQLTPDWPRPFKHRRQL